MALPETMLAARLRGAMSTGIREFEKEELEKVMTLDTVPVPKPRAGQVLIKVHRSILNPMNLSELKASYGTWNKDKHKEPPTMGAEGVGTVVASGPGLSSVLGWRLVGKRVAFFKYNSAWAEYACVPWFNCIVLDPSVPDNLATSAFANPMTVLAFTEIAAKHKSPAAVISATASTCGQFLCRYGKRIGLKVIGVVRREEQKKLALANGAVEVVLSTDPDYVDQLRAACVRHGATVAFDCVAGQTTGDILNALPNGGTIYVYGGLSEQRPVISTRDLIFKKKTCTGFWLKYYLEDKYSVELLRWTYTVADRLNDDFAINIAAEFPLTQIHDAVLSYSKSMGDGKVVIVCEKK